MAAVHACEGPHQRLAYSVDGAAEQLSISKTVLWELIKDGDLPLIHYGEGRRRVGITHEALVAFIRDRQDEERHANAPMRSIPAAPDQQRRRAARQVSGQRNTA